MTDDLTRGNLAQRTAGDGARALCLIAVPAAFAFVPWVVAARTNDWQLTDAWIAALAPTLGLVGVVAYWWVTREPVQVWPFALYALALVASPYR